MCRDVHERNDAEAGIRCLRPERRQFQERSARHRHGLDRSGVELPGLRRGLQREADSSGAPTIVLFTRVTLAVNGTANCANPGSNTSGNTSVTLKGTLTNAGVTDFGKKLTVPNVDTAPLPLDDFQAGIQRGNYVQGRCNDTNKTWNFRGVFDYSGVGQARDTVNATQACTVG